MHGANMSVGKISGFAMKSSDVPAGEHYAIIQFSSIHIPGDQRSIDAPGHGYPAHEEPTVSYRWFLDRANWEQTVAALAGVVFGKPDFVAMYVKPAKVNMEIKVTVG